MIARAAIGLAFLSCALAQSPEPVVRNVGKLGLHQPVERELGAGQTDVFTVDVEAGQFLHVVVEKMDVDLLILLADPDGKTTDAPDPIRAFGVTPASLIAARTGTHQIRVAKSKRNLRMGRYRIELTDLHVPTDQDRIELRAESEFITASNAHRTDAPAQRLKTTEAYLSAAALWQSIRFWAGEALCLQRVGAIYASLGEQEKALDFYNQALPLWHSAGELANEALTLTDMGISHYHIGDMQAALDYANRAILLYRAAGDHVGEARGLLNLANIYSDTGDKMKALGYFKEVLTVAREAGERAAEGATLNNMGWAYYRLGKMEQALDHYNQSLALRREVKDRSGEALTLNNIGVVYWRLGEKHTALDYFDTALPLYRAVGEQAREAGTLNNIGIIHGELGEYQKALEYQNRALALYRATSELAGQGRVLYDIGIIYQAQGEKARAVEHFTQGLKLARLVGDRDTQASALSSIGEVYQRNRKMRSALRYYVQALELANAASAPFRVGEILGDLMDYWQARHRPGPAIFFGKRAVNQYQELRRNIGGLNQELQRTYLDTVSRNYRKLADLLTAQGRLAEAEQILGLLKEQEYFDYLRRDAAEASINGLANLNPEESEADKRYHEIEDKLITIGVERGKLIAKKSLTKDETLRLDQLEKDIAAGNAAFEKFLSNLAHNFAAQPAIALRVEELRETQAMMEDLRELPNGTVVIFTLIGEDRFRTILRTPDVQKAYDYPIKAAELNRKVLEFRQVAQQLELDPRPRAKDLYDIILGRMAKDLRAAKAQTLMWSLDGVLRYLPIAALYDGRHYLIEQYRVSVVTLASNTRLLGVPERQWKAAGFGVSKSYGDQPALPSVSNELAGIIATKPGDPGVLPGEVKLDDKFTRESMRHTLLKRYPVVHIASHFRFEPGNETRSFLLLGDGTHLSLGELRTSANLFGGVQLLTLSACNTGMGDGTEVEGFGTLAQRQGAKAVIASLWPVADDSTSLLMREFYGIRQSSPGMTKLEALREAQLSLLHGTQRFAGTAAASRGLVHESENSRTQTTEPRFSYEASKPFAHPYYWAPFFLMGNWL